MNQENNTAYSIDFKIKCGATLPNFHKFVVNEVTTCFYKGQQFYKTKNEAIDAAIQHLTSLKDK